MRWKQRSSGGGRFGSAAGGGEAMPVSIGVLVEPFEFELEPLACAVSASARTESQLSPSCSVLAREYPNAVAERSTGSRGPLELESSAVAIAFAFALGTCSTGAFVSGLSVAGPACATAEDTSLVVFAAAADELPVYVDSIALVFEFVLIGGVGALTASASACACGGSWSSATMGLPAAGGSRSWLSLMAEELVLVSDSGALLLPLELAELSGSGAGTKRSPSPSPAPPPRLELE